MVRKDTISKIVYVMSELAIFGIISGILSALGIGINAYQTKKANERQEEHDLAMAALNHRYREEEAASSFEREATFNQFSSDAQKMREAGLSPALMYGQYSGNSTPQVSSVGSSQSAGNVGRTINASDFFGRLDPSEYAEAAIQRMNARTMAEKTRSDVSLQNQYELESISRTLENQRNTAFKKNLETTIFNQEQEKLNQLRIGNETGQFELGLAKDTRELQIEKMRLQNKDLEKRIDLTVEQIKTEPVKRQHLAKEMEEIEAATQNYYANKDLLQENLKSGQIGRIMREFGLNARTLNPMLRNGEVLNLPYKTQMQGASIALQELGFSEFEATNAVLYYMANDPKDVTPSVINGFSRILSKGK